jgi:hypothetical protein
MARRAHFDVERLADGRRRRERVAAAAGHLDFGVFGVDAGFHRVLFLGLGGGSRDSHDIPGSAAR